MPKINRESLNEIRIAIPPEWEQKEISSHINKATDAIDRLISISHKAIKLLNERRSALISAAVTGKIDVRGWRAGSNGAKADLPELTEQAADYSAKEARA